MSSSIIITFRESLEALLLIVPLLIYLHKIKRDDLEKYIYVGCIAGVVLSIIVGSLLIGQVNSLEGYMRQAFQGAMMIFLAALVLYNIVWIFKQDKGLKINQEEIYNIKLKWTSLFLIAFLNVFREGVEIIIFVVPVTLSSPFKMAASIVIGLFCSLSLTFILFKTTIKLNVKLLFSILTFMLIIIGGELLGEGLVYILPNIKNAELFGKIIFIGPLMFVFAKRTIKKYMRKT
ncbi:MAG: FTR1 family protein [Clostridium sp.]|nr:FTR1 family protein [Clostridium sp.]